MVGMVGCTKTEPKLLRDVVAASRPSSGGRRHVRPQRRCERPSSSLSLPSASSPSASSLSSPSASSPYSAVFSMIAKSTRTRDRHDTCEITRNVNQKLTAQNCHIYKSSALPIKQTELMCSKYTQWTRLPLSASHIVINIWRPIPLRTATAACLPNRGQRKSKKSPNVRRRHDV